MAWNLCKDSKEWRERSGIKRRNFFCLASKIKRYEKWREKKYKYLNDIIFIIIDNIIIL